MRRTAAGLLAAAPLLLLVPGCRQDMHDQPRYKPLAASDFFGDGRSARPLPEDTVARGHLKDDALLQTGKQGKDYADLFPMPVNLERLERGRQRFEIFCAPCHGLAGYGDGMVSRRGFRIKPASLHQDRLREQPAGYFFDVITNGFGAMQDYAAQVPVEDRWAIVAYVRALQKSQHARLDEVPVAERERLAQPEAPAAPATHQP